MSEHQELREGRDWNNKVLRSAGHVSTNSSRNAPTPLLTEQGANKDSRVHKDTREDGRNKSYASKSYGKKFSSFPVQSRIKMLRDK